MPIIDEASGGPDRGLPVWPSSSGAMSARIRVHDWASTALGPIDGWPQSLRSGIELVLSAGVPMMLMASPRLIQIYNDSFADLVGNNGAARLGQPFQDGEHAVPTIAAPIIERVLAGETVSLDKEQPVLHGRDADRWFNASLSPARDDVGQIAGVILIAFDVTEQILMQRRLAAELQHRVRNSLSIVRSIARRTAENSDSLDECAYHLEGRLGAYARVQAAVTRYMAGDPDLYSIIADEMAAHATHEGDQLTLSGPDVRLHSKAAETLGLAFHELTTNAIKFGALSVDEGSIAVSWRVDTDGRLSILWEEHLPDPALQSPTHRGFGTELLERTLAYDLEAETTLEYAPSGLQCTIVIPLAANVAELDA